MKTPGVVTYYTDTVWDYFLFWMNTRTLAMHYGYWDKSVTSHDASLIRLNEVIADRLHLTTSDYVVDAGCGLGGSALWVAQHRGCNVLGISITPDQIRRANEYAKKKHLEHLVTFRVADYTKLDIPTGTIDAVFAIETICHLKDPGLFYGEMYRILKPAGRLLVADGVTIKKHMNAQDKDLMHEFIRGWAVSQWLPLDDHIREMKRAGFSHILHEYYSEKTLPSAKRLYYLSILGIPLYRFLHWVGILPTVRMSNAESCRYQWVARQRGLWGHAMWWGQRPNNA